MEGAMPAKLVAAGGDGVCSSVWGAENAFEDEFVKRKDMAILVLGMMGVDDRTDVVENMLDNSAVL